MMKTQLTQENFSISSSSRQKIFNKKAPIQAINLNLNNAVAKLIELAHQKQTGILKITYHQIQWNIYLDNGKLQYASISIQSLDDLTYHLRYLEYDNVTTDAIKTAKSVGKNATNLETLSMERLIKWLKQKGIINSRQMSQIIHQVSQEALEPIVWLPDNNYHYRWQKLTPIDLQKKSLSPSPCDDIPTLIQQYKNRLQTWQTVVNRINSPYQRPYFFKAYDEITSSPVLQELSNLKTGYSIHQIAKILQKDELELAQILAPYIKTGEIVLRDPHSPWDQLPKIPTIAYESFYNTDEAIKNLRSIVDAIRNRSGLIRTNSYKLRIYPRSLVGQELVTWLSQQLNYSRQEAVLVGQALIDQGWLHHTWDDHNFKDEYLFYRFYQDERWSLPLLTH